ncbi:hypothetical protein KVV02_000066 [Mortierella alpina]|uniref:Uncharacterized protein n=1 Tax=Mortierella alpina TaxID=64518 RepID=A0A9P8CVD3_MORAP|nr:hypothetical protein KVV02_000066 [Mortierella alpina]
MAPALTAVYAKVRSWAASITSPSSTHASGMLIILGILAAVTDAQSVKEPIRVHHPKVASSRSQAAAASDPNAAGSSDKLGANHEGGADAQQINSQEMMYYLAMGMLVSQGLIRLITFISNRREAAALAAQKKNDDLLQDDTNNEDNDSATAGAKKTKRKGLSLNALEDLDEEMLKQKRKEHLAALGDNASLLGSDSEDDDYEQSDEESSSEEELEEEEEESEEDEEAVEDSESEGEIERRRRVLAAGDAEIEE